MKKAREEKVISPTLDEDFFENPSWTFEVANMGEFINVITKWSEKLKLTDLVLLSGVVGAGKTQLVRVAVESLGGRWVSSPSFAIHQRYALVKGFADHVDLYRLTSDVDLDSTGFWDLFDHKDSIVFIEWAERIAESAWPRDRTRWHVGIEVTGTQSRKVHIEKKS
jgi:tRNA threonylcarbamoyladenosine biosynthesis protein TsaE